MGWHAVGDREIARHHTQVAVLDTGMEADPVAPAAQRVVERGDDRVALRAVEVTGGEVDHRARVVDGDEVAPVRDLGRIELHAHRRGLDRRATGVVHRGVVTEDRQVADVAPRRETVGNHRREADFTRGGEGGQARHVRGFEWRAMVELVERLVGTTVGDEHEILHDREW